jgi:ribosome-associated heat shock protein Hsp15
MRLDTWIRKVGLLKRRTLAAQLLRNGLILVDGQPAKPATVVRPGQRVRIEGPRLVKTWEVLGVPEGNVRKADGALYARLLEETRRDEA